MCGRLLEVQESTNFELDVLQIDKAGKLLKYVHKKQERKCIDPIFSAFSVASSFESKSTQGKNTDDGPALHSFIGLF